VERQCVNVMLETLFVYYFFYLFYFFQLFSFSSDIFLFLLLLFNDYLVLLLMMMLLIVCIFLPTTCVCNSSFSRSLFLSLFFLFLFIHSFLQREKKRREREKKQRKKAKEEARRNLTKISSSQVPLKDPIDIETLAAVIRLVAQEKKLNVRIFVMSGCSIYTKGNDVYIDMVVVLEKIELLVMGITHTWKHTHTHTDTRTLTHTVGSFSRNYFSCFVEEAGER